VNRKSSRITGSAGRGYSKSESADQVNLSVAKSMRLILLLGVHSAGVLISIPGDRFKSLERIPAEIQNLGNKPITFCAEIGQTSPSPGENGSESTPFPFEVQANSGRRWHTLMIGPDAGSLRHPEVLKPENSIVFPFRLRQTGKTRLVLTYWDGSIPTLDCGHPPKGVKRLKSQAFVVQ
jgi:hypothetical protein